MSKQFKNKALSFRINDEINSYGNVRVIGDGIETKVVSLNEAKKMALSMEKDLIEINSKVTPPIMLIGIYEKFLYEMKKNEKKKKQQANASQLKEVQLRVNIAKHDLETKVKKAKEFIADGDKVKVTLTMRGREMTRVDESKKSLYEFIVMMEDVSSIEGKIRDDGNRSTVILKKK